MGVAIAVVVVVVVVVVFVVVVVVVVVAVVVVVVNIRGVTKKKNLNLRQITGKRQSILASIKLIGANGL